MKQPILLRAPNGIKALALLLPLACASLEVSAGSIARLFYEGITGTTVASFTADPQFPNAPTFREQLDDFTPGPGGASRFGLQGRDNSSVQFGTWIRGYLEAPETGDYVFYIASDDNGELWLSSDHSEAGKEKIAFESGAGTSLFTGPRLEERRSRAIPLERGRKYYLEVLQKQGGGASLIQVGWERPDGTQEIIPARHLAQHPDDPYLGRSVSTPIFNPDGRDGGNLPPSATVAEGGEILLELDVIAQQPTTIQWTLGGQPIPGESLSFLRLRNIPASGNGKLIEAQINSPGGTLRSSGTRLTVTPDPTPPQVADVRHGGNPNQLRVAFTERVSASATNRANYELRSSNGTALPIEAASLLPGETTVVLQGAFNFQRGAHYALTIRDVQDTASTPNTLTPNPTLKEITFDPEPGTLYAFDEALPSDWAIYGSAAWISSGGAGGGYLQLTEAAVNQSGAAVLAPRRFVDQVRVKFKARIADGGVRPGEGFSLTLADDLPRGAFGGAEEGFNPNAEGPRFLVAFDALAQSTADPAGFAVNVNGQIVTNVTAGQGGRPSIHSAAGAWVDVDVHLQRDGKFSLTYGGVRIVDQLQTEFTGVPNAQLGLAARTSDNFATHAFDAIEVSFADGDIGPVAVLPGSDLTSRTVAENDLVRLSVLPSGASPFDYQWFKNGEPIEGATNRVLRFIAQANSAGQYAVRVRNDFSEAVSPTATLTLTSDVTAPEVLSVAGYAAGLNQVHIAFSEAVDPVTAQNPATYDASPLQVLGATLAEDGRQVTLTTSPQSAGAYYGIEIRGLKDRAQPPNATSAWITFRSASSYEAEVLADRPVRYWRFEEIAGATALSEAAGADTDVNGAYRNAPLLGQPSLVASQPGASAVGLVAASSQNITVPNGSDLNAAPGPWAKKSFSFWFRANSVPPPGSAGLEAVAGIWEQGADTRGAQVYLWRDPADNDPNRAKVVFHAFNNAADGPGAPFGQGGSRAISFVSHPVRVGETYHVVAVMDGDPIGTSGQLRLYVNGALVDEAGGVGQLYTHTGDVQIGHGNGRHHNQASGAASFFDGLLDEFAVYNVALPAKRVLAQYQAGIGLLPETSAPVLVEAATLGNPNGLRATFDQTVDPGTATRVENYTVRSPGGAPLSITQVSRVPGSPAVEIQGNFNFQPGTEYELVARDVVNLANPAQALSPNPTVVRFTHPADAGQVGIGPGSRLGPVTGTENQTIRFDVEATGSGPYSYQWFFNDEELPGETHAFLKIIAAEETAGAYRVRVRNAFSEVLSAPAILTFRLDSAPAQVVRAQALAGGVNEFRLQFDEPLDPVTAAKPGTYSVAGAAISAATLREDARSVTLTSSGLVQGREYTLQIRGLKDQSSTGNPLSVDVPVVAEVSYFDEILVEAPVRYWRFDEATGSKQAVTVVTHRDNIATAFATLRGGTTAGADGLVPNVPNGRALRFDAAAQGYLSVPNGADINVTAGPWATRTFSFWFQAASLPRGGADPEAPVIWEEGGDSRGLGIYLYGTQDTTSPTEALLVWNVYNNAADGPTGSWGVALGNPAASVHVTAPVQAGRAYHVVAVFNGSSTGLDGSLRLHLDGELVGEAHGAGQLFNHSADVQIGRGAFVRHDGVTGGNRHHFDGVLDEFVILNHPLDSARVSELHAIALTPATEAPSAPTFTELRFQAGQITLVWEGDARLERKDAMDEPFVEVPGAASPYTQSTAGSPGAFFRLVR